MGHDSARARDRRETHDSRVAAGFSDRAALDAPLGSEERLQIARDLHDGPAQTLSAALLQLRMLANRPAAGDSDDLVPELEHHLRRALEDIYLLIGILRNRADRERSLSERLTAGASRDILADGGPASLVIVGTEPPLPAETRAAIERMVNEALGNIARHANATSAEVRVEFGTGKVLCTIADNGDGFDALELLGTREQLTYGLAGMRERAELLGGTCDIVSAHGEGTTVTLSIPVRESTQ